MSFELYKAETPYLRFEDYGLIIEEVKRANAKTALEFGPGASTLALIESGLEHIVTCLVSRCIVHHLEAVEIKKQQR